MTDPHIVMQTKAISYKSNTNYKWKTLTRCAKDASSIQCEIDENHKIWQYNVRIVNLSCNSSLRYLMWEPDAKHYQG